MLPALLVLLLSLSADVRAQSSNGSSGFGYELLLAKLQYMEDRLINIQGEMEALRKQQADDRQNVPSSCRGISSTVSGVYRVQPSKSFTPMDVRCEMAFDGGGWIVVQNRPLGNESFNRTWNEYEEGFGHLDSDFWLGLKPISAIVNNGLRWEIVFVAVDWNYAKFIAKYSTFKLGSATDKYTLRELGKFYGANGNWYTKFVGKKFSTFDQDNALKPCNCTAHDYGGWWDDSHCCSRVSLNSVIGKEGHGIGRFTNSTSIMIREALPST